MAKKAAKPNVKAPFPFQMEMRDPETLTPNEKNWRKHPARQREAYRALKAALGWAGFALFNKRSGRLVDGHMRVSEALKTKEKVPTIIVDWTEEQESLALAQFDPLGSLAETNATALANLAAGSEQALKSLNVGKSTKKALANLTEDLNELSAKIEAGEAPSVLIDRTEKRRRNIDEKHNDDSYDEESGVRENKLKDDLIFPIENEFGIPTLLPSRLCTVIPRHTWDRSSESTTSDAWYCQSAGSATFPQPEVRQGGILGFFCEDWRFEVAWNATAEFTERLLSQDWSGVALPDFSTWTDWPLVVSLHNIYRSRWCGRYWQEAGIPVIPILQSCGDSEPMTEVCLSFLPRKIPVAAIQCRTNDGTTGYWNGFCKFVALAKSIVKIESLVIYGGLEHWKSFSKRLPKGIDYVPIDSFVARRRGR